MLVVAAIEKSDEQIFIEMFHIHVYTYELVMQFGLNHVYFY